MPGKSGLEPNTRFVTAHDSSGKSTFMKEGTVDVVPVGGGAALFALMWSTDTAKPDVVNDERDGGEASPQKNDGVLCRENGNTLRYIDFPPQSKGLMHRTDTLDYGIVLKGDIELELDSGEKKSMKSGDVAVQRGTNHAWNNNTGNWTRMAFVMIDAQPVAHDNDKVTAFAP
ncbi:hypothetical protein YB2330_005223 [Saitoella coloradoensis]